MNMLYNAENEWMNMLYRSIKGWINEWSENG